jgi:hypothetical protein
MNWLLLSLLYSVAGIAITIVILRITFSIQEFLRYQKALIKILSEIAIKQDVDLQIIENIKKEAKL